MKKMRCVLITIFLFCMSTLAFSEQQSDNTKLYEFAIKYLSASEQDYEQLRAELDTFLPQEKNEIYRIIRKVEVSQDRHKISDKEYLNWLKLEEVFLIAEKIALEKYNKAFNDISETDLKIIMKEAISQYPGSLELQSYTESSCC